MKCILKMYNLTSIENKSKTKKFLHEIHLDELKHFKTALKYLIENEFDDFANEIVLRLKKFKNGKHQIYYNLIEDKKLKRVVENFIKLSFPIIA